MKGEIMQIVSVSMVMFRDWLHFVKVRTVVLINTENV